MQAVDPSPDCDVTDCIVCDVSAGRCPGSCRACDLIDAVFPAFAGTFGRCLDCECDPCASRRGGVRRGAGQDVGGTTDQVPRGG